MSRTTIFATTAAVLVCVWLGVAHFGANGPGTMAYAEVLAQIEKAKTVTSKRTVYIFDEGSKHVKPKWAKILTQDWVIQIAWARPRGAAK